MQVVPTSQSPSELGADQLSTERLEADVCTLAAQLAAATCKWLMLIGELDHREAYKDWGCASMAQWLSWKCGLGIVAGRQHVRVARALQDLPLIRDRFAAGVLTYSKVRALTRIATPATEASLLEFAEVTTAAQLERAVRVYERVCVDKDAAAAQVAARSLTVHHDDDGMVTIVARFPRDAAENVLTAINRAAKDVPVDPDDDSAESRRADALESIAQSFLAGGADRPPTEMVVHVDVERLEDPERSPVLQRLMCDAGVRVTVTREDGTVEASRRTRTIPRRLRRWLEKRDQGCRFPGCTNALYTQAHHIVPFCDDGPTDSVNCVTLCTFHHRLVHEGGWRIQGDSAESRALTFVSPHGRVVGEHDEPREPTSSLPVDPRIDHHTADTAEGGRLDLDLAITALESTFRPHRN
jgi:hypothetical protein